VANLQYLQYILDGQSGALLYTVSMVTGWDTSFTCPASTVVMPGVSGGMNTRGSLPNPMAPRTAILKFFRRYGASENYETVRDTLVGALRGKELQLQVLQPDGTQRTTYGQLTDFPDRRTIGTSLIAEFEVHFSLTSPVWKSLVPANTPQYDKGFLYDNAVLYDAGTILPLSADANSITLTNHGNAAEYEGVYTFLGPFAGPFSVTNFSDQRLSGGFCNFIYNGTLANGDTLVVDTGLRSILKNGISDFGNLQWGLGVAQREWFRLKPGANTIQVAHGGGGATGGSMVPLFYDTWE
jgi:hypothetical protein